MFHIFIKYILEYTDTRDPVIRGLTTFIKDIVAYIYVEGASCLGHKELSSFIKVIVAYIYVDGASCLGHRELSSFIKDNVAYI